ncbi:MAG: hypothetical protein ACREM1_22440 [Longimicrobiales bacterium]
MAESLLDRVLTIEETKLRMKDIRDRAVHQHAVIRFGDRGRDEMVIVSSAVWEEVNAKKQQSLAADRPASPFAAFAHLLEQPQPAATEREPRRRMRGLRDTSGVPIDEMIRLAGEAEKPRRRRAG